MDQLRTVSDRAREQVTKNPVPVRYVGLRDCHHGVADGVGACRWKLVEPLRISRVKLRAHCAACGTCASAQRLRSSRLPAGRPSSTSSARSADSTETARTRCRSAAAMGSAVVAGPERDLHVHVRIVAGQPDHRRNQPDQLTATGIRGVVVDQARQACQQRMGARRMIAPSRSGEVRDQFHEARALARAPVLASRDS